MSTPTIVRHKALINPEGFATVITVHAATGITAYYHRYTVGLEGRTVLDYSSPFSSEAAAVKYFDNHENNA